MRQLVGATRGDILGLHSDGQGDSFPGGTLEKWLGGHPSAAGWNAVLSRLFSVYIGIEFALLLPHCPTHISRDPPPRSHKPKKLRLMGQILQNQYVHEL